MFRKNLIVAVATILLISFTGGEEVTATEKETCTVPTDCKAEQCGVEPITEEGCKAAGHEFVSKESLCDCCNQCVTYLEEGDKCNDVNLIMKTSFTTWLNVQRHCKPPLECNDVCVSKKED